jgi:signal transduction histidine kinase
MIPLTNSKLLDKQVISDEDDELVFIEEDEEESLNKPIGSWKILIVDDEVMVHQVTKHVLQSFRFEQKSLTFVSAYSASEAKALMESHPDAAIILLDVVMESKDSGLMVAKYIREVLQNQLVRIILRTGQPGEVPEESVIVAYDINDYKTKTELTRSKLFTTIVASLRSYRDLTNLEASRQTLQTLSGKLSQRSIELGQLNQQLQLEIRQRKEAQEALQEAHDELEERVKERTADFQEANTLLKQELVERKRIEEALAAQAQALSRSNAELEQFAYVASHDLREPLRKIKSYTELLEIRYKGKLDARADKYIAYTVDGATRMQALITALLTYSRMGKEGVALEQINIETILKEVLDDLELVIRETKARISYNSLPCLMADPSQLRHLLQNLIENGIKFQGEESPQLEISAERKENEWLFAVRDNGIGIEPQYAERIFRIFQRLHTRTEYSGTGIGLAICKKIVERHGGRIWVESQIHEGSTFYFTIPTNS